MIGRRLLTIGPLSPLLAVPYAAPRRFFRRPRPHVARVGTMRGVALEDVPAMRADLENEGYFKVPKEEEYQ